MSEIRSIAEGTFVLGDTNGLTFEAGPGIKITEPSEGTVRITNDETVLFSAANPYDKNRTSITLSESYKNFEELKIYWAHHIGDQFTEQITYSDTQEANDFMCIGGRGSNTNQITHFEAAWVADNNTTLTARACMFSTFAAGQSISWANSNELMPYKVIGINRISGSNP